MLSEIQPLLSHSKPSALLSKCRMAKKHCWPRNLCIPSKAAVLIILWTLVIATATATFNTIIPSYFYTIPHTYLISAAVNGSIPYAISVVLMTFYPLSGFIADVCCGRFKIIMVSQILITISFILCCPVVLLLREQNVRNSFKLYSFLQGEGISALILLLFALTLLFIGVIGYHANFMQFGLDQLLEAPSESLGLFIHYASWAFNINLLLVMAALEIMMCYSTRKHDIKRLLLLAELFLLAIVSIVLLLINCWKRQWFYKEPRKHNPYKTVYKVLNFARKHKHPLQRSAFTFGDDYMPSRLDFAKERYGGSFTTEQVENVKTLSRIIVLLLSLGPVHMLQVPASQYIFPLFGYHTGYHSLKIEHWTRAVQNGLLIILSSNVLFPIYIWCIFSALRRRIPSMFKRLGLGIVLSLVGVISMFITDILGHSLNTGQSANHTKLQCMFQVTMVNYTSEFHSLNMHWYVLIPPSVLLGIGPQLVTTTTLEFISAQSPHTMKGLVVGVFFALYGFFQLLGFIITLPFSITNSWINEAIPSSISCGFIYLLLICVAGLIGFIFFLLAAKRYKYRKRDDENFNQMNVEDVYIRYITQDEEAYSYSNELDD